MLVFPLAVLSFSPKVLLQLPFLNCTCGRRARMLRQSPNVGITAGQASEPLTILRVKRKRDQEPLEALVIHQQRRKIASQGDVHTSEGLASGGLASGGLASGGLASKATTDTGDRTESSEKPLLFALGETISEAEFGDASRRIALQSRLTSLAKRRHEDTAMQQDGTQGAPKPEQATGPGDARQTKFRVVGKRQIQLADDTLQQPATKSTNYGIPQVLASADLEPARDKIRMFDAINEDDFLTTQSKGRPDPYADLALGRPSSTNANGDSTQDIMDTLLPMVRDYLSFSQPKPEYVYDFYYVQQSHAGMDPNILRAPNVGTVLWVDDAEEFTNGGDSDDDGNSDDADSNAEDYYTNDYPDEPEYNSEIDDYYYSSDEREQLQNNDLDAYSDCEW
ncbi:hypothetical protein GQ54DRAFT_139237 [Martensiomyces pterosporus]|nr:hypothetical protein GQ54DRAFT_139237 [Martensiomyces pterosporus]